MDNQKSKRTPFLRIPAVQTIVASLLCVLAGLLIGYSIRETAEKLGIPATTLTRLLRKLGKEVAA